MELLTLDFLARWSHTLFGITWIGMLYYFNFVQGGYFKAASPEGLADAKAKLAPSALWWFRWGAMLTFITGVILLGVVGSRLNSFTVLGATLGTLMFLNVWLVIWPNQKIALGITPGGDAAAAGAKALLASRTNTLFSAPMLMGMFASFHGAGGGMYPLTADGANYNGLIIALVIIALLEANALVGKQGPLTTVKGVISCSLAMTVMLAAIIQVF